MRHWGEASAHWGWRGWEPASRERAAAPVVTWCLTGPLSTLGALSSPLISSLAYGLWSCRVSCLQSFYGNDPLRRCSAGLEASNQRADAVPFSGLVAIGRAVPNGRDSLSLSAELTVLSAKIVSFTVWGQFLSQILIIKTKPHAQQLGTVCPSFICKRISLLKLNLMGRDKYELN